MNKKIYDANDKILRSNPKGEITLYEVPFSRRLYTWDTNVVDFSGEHNYYTFYLGKWYEEYYEVKLDRVKMVPWDGD